MRITGRQRMSKQAQKLAARLGANLRTELTLAKLESQLERASVCLSGSDLDQVQAFLHAIYDANGGTRQP